MKMISILNAKKEELAVISRENEKLTLIVAEKYSHLKGDMERLVSFLEKQKSFDMKKSSIENGAIIESVDRVQAGDENYLEAITAFINKQKLGTPRVFAVMKRKEEKGNV